jgi:hypothetical protein
MVFSPFYISQTNRKMMTYYHDKNEINYVFQPHFYHPLFIFLSSHHLKSILFSSFLASFIQISSHVPVALQLQEQECVKSDRDQAQISFIVALIFDARSRAPSVKPNALFFDGRLSNTTLFALVGAVGALRQHLVGQSRFRMSQAFS